MKRKPNLNQITKAKPTISAHPLAKLLSTKNQQNTLAAKVHPVVAVAAVTKPFSFFSILCFFHFKSE
jgi:hypothetical protein